MTARLGVTAKMTEENRIVRNGKSEAEVTNTKQVALLLQRGRVNGVMLRVCQ